MDNVTMNILYKKVCRPYIAGFDGESRLSLDVLRCTKILKLLEFMKEDKTNRYMIVRQYTVLLQQCDVGISKPLNDRLKKAAGYWRREQQKLLESGNKLLSPKRKDALNF